MEQPTFREAVAVFDDAEKLEGAVSELQSNGIDRSELSFLAHPSLARRMPADLRQAADDPATPREPVVSDTDLRQGRVLGTSLAATVAAFAAAGFTVATGGVGAAIAAAAVAAGGVGAASTLFGRKLAEDQASFLDAHWRAAVCCFGCARATPPASKQCSKCSGAGRSTCTCTICRLKRQRFISR